MNLEDFGDENAVYTELIVRNNNAVDDQYSWLHAVDVISINGNDKNYVITVEGEVTGIDGFTLPTFVSAFYIKLSIRGAASSALSIAGVGGVPDGGDGSLIMGESTTVILRGPALRGKSGNTRPILHLNGGESRLVSGDISGNGGNSVLGGGVWCNSTFTMDGGTIRDNTAPLAGGVWCSGGAFTMNGGTISGNTAYGVPGDDPNGGGVRITGGGATFIMNGGTIRNNTGTRGGGVVCYNSGPFTMNGGTIKDNTSSGGSNSNGGGVYCNSRFIMNGGTISGNTADLRGGGVYFNSGDFYKYGGTIYGKNEGANSNTAGEGDTKGHAAYNARNNPNRYRDATTGTYLFWDTYDGWNQ
jgi:hypothetical protein